MTENKSNRASKRFKITKPEIQKLKTFIDFLFYDQTKYYASFSRFEESLSFINDTVLHLDLFSLFKEIAGPNHKYITIPRIIQKFLEYKSYSRSVSIQLKQFFSYIITTLIKDLNVHAGNDINAKLFSSTNYINNNRLSALTLIQSSSSIIDSSLCGFILEYDNIFQSNLYDECARNIESLKATEYKLRYMNELKAYDGITHVYGTYTNRITFLAFKCRSGLTIHYGTPRGEPFLFGEYGKELKCLKTQIEKGKGVMMIKTLFADTTVTNFSIDSIGSEEINDNSELLTDNYLIFEEKSYEKAREIMTDDVIKFNMVKDYNDSIKRNVEQKIQFLQKNKSTEKTDDIDIQEVKKEAVEYYNFLLKEKKENGNEKEENEDNQQEKVNLRFNRKNLRLKLAPNWKETSKWTGSSMKKATFEEIIKSKDNYSKIIERLKFEIERELNKEFLKYEYDQNFDFYDEYLMKYELLDPFPLSPKHFDSYGVVKEIEYDFATFNNEMEIEAKQEGILSSKIYTIKDENKSYDEKTIASYWRTSGKRLVQMNITSLVIALLSIRKAMQIIESTEDNFFDDNTNLRKKIQIYKAIVKNKRIVSFILKNMSPSIRANYLLRYKKKLDVASPSTEVDVFNNISDEEIANTNLFTINKKLKLIESISGDDRLHHQLTALYLKLRKLRLIHTTLLNNEQTSKIKSMIPQYEQIEKEIEKEIPKLNQGETIVKPQNEDIKFNVLSDSNPENPEQIYKKQKIPKDVFEYQDPLFPPNQNSIGEINFDHLITTQKNINWEKADLILYTNNFCTLSKTNHFDLKSTFISSGLYNNFYFVSAIFALLKYPSIIYNLFPFTEKSGNGCYGVYLRINGIWKLVLLDDHFPCCSNERNHKYFAFASVPEKEIWIQLLEKAWAKICGGYDKIQNGTVNEIFDLCTNSPTEKIEIGSISQEILLKTLLDSTKENYIIVAKSNHNSSCTNVGLIPNTNYIVENIKLFYIGAISEYLIKMKNIFGSMKYCGDWSINNYKWIPSLKNEINNQTENDFYISLSDFASHFSVLYINKIHPVENDSNYVYSYLHYTKFEINKPNIALLSIPDNREKTKLTIQFHQKNKRFSSSNDKLNVPAMILITDKKNRYIKSIASSAQSFSLELDLSSGDYYVYTDITYRYFSPISQHGYTLSSYSDKEINLSKDIDETIEPGEFLKNAVLSYAKKNTTCLKGDLGLKMYKSNKKNFLFPFEFAIYENEGEFENDVSFTVKNKFDSVKNFAFYIENEEFNNEKDNIKNSSFSGDGKGVIDVKYNKTVKGGETATMMVLKLSEINSFEITDKVETKVTDDELEEYILRCGSREQLDEEEMLIQYMIEYKNGYCVLIENKYDDEEFKMKLILKGLVYPPQPKGDVYFRLKEKEIKLFKLGVSEMNASGIVSFQFQFA